MRYVAFLRAINVGGHVVKMEVLRKEFAGLGFAEVETFIASGNVIFSTRSSSVAALERRIEARLFTTLGYEVKTFLRTDAEVAAVAVHRPFTPARVRESVALCVGFLTAPLGAPGVKAVAGFRTAQDEFQVHGREVYWSSTVGQSDSAFNNARFERTLKLSATWRGLKTVVRLADKLAG